MIAALRSITCHLPLGRKSAIGRRLVTGRRSGCVCQCRWAPTPDFGQFPGRATAMPRNLPVGGGRANGKAQDVVATSDQRPLPMDAIWDSRPSADVGQARGLTRLLTVARATAATSVHAQRLPM